MIYLLGDKGHRKMMEAAKTELEKAGFPTTIIEDLLPADTLPNDCQLAFLFSEDSVSWLMPDSDQREKIVVVAPGLGPENEKECFTLGYRQCFTSDDYLKEMVNFAIACLTPITILLRAALNRRINDLRHRLSI